MNAGSERYEHGTREQMPSSAAPTWTDERVRAAARLYLLADTGLLKPDELPAMVCSELEGGVTLVRRAGEAADHSGPDSAGGVLRDVCGEGGAVRRRRSGRRRARRRRRCVYVGHIGQEDMEPADARRLIGSGALVGVSVE